MPVREGNSWNGHPKRKPFSTKAKQTIPCSSKEVYGVDCVYRWMDRQTGWFQYTPLNFVCGGGGGIKNVLATKQRDLCKHGIYMHIYYCTPFMIHTFFKMDTWKQFMLNLELPRRPQLMMIFQKTACVF